MACARARLVVVAALMLAISACAAPAKKTSKGKSSSRPAATATKSAPSKTPASKSSTGKSTTTATARPNATPTAPQPASKTAAKPATKTTTAAKPVAPAPAPAFRTGPGAPQPVTPAQTAKAPAASKTPAAAPAPPPPPVVTPKERYAKALAALKANQLQDAETALLVSTTRDYPKDTGPHTNLGIVYARTNRRAQAKASFDRAVAIDDDNAIAWNWLGVIAREGGDYPGAERYYRRALEADSRYAAAHLNLGILYDQYLKRPAEALAAYRRYVNLIGKEDLRTAVWIAELEASLPKPAAPSATQQPAPPRKPGARS